MAHPYHRPPTDGSFQSHIYEFDYQRGVIIGLWAGIETSIDQANRFAWHYTSKAISNVVPQDLRWKLQTFEQLHTELAPFHSLRATAAGLLARLKSLYDERHWLAHGVMLAHRCGEADWLIAKSEFQKNGDAPMLERTFSYPELISLREQVLRLREQVLRLALDFADYNNAFVAQMPKDTDNDIRR